MCEIFRDNTTKTLITMDHTYWGEGVGSRSRYLQVETRGHIATFRYDLWGWLAWWLTPQRAVAKAFKYVAHMDAYLGHGRAHAQAAVQAVESVVEVEKALAATGLNQ